MSELQDNVSRLMPQVKALSELFIQTKNGKKQVQLSETDLIALALLALILEKRQGT